MLIVLTSAAIVIILIVIEVMIRRYGNEFKGDL